MSTIFAGMRRLRRTRVSAMIGMADRAIYWALYNLSPARRLAFFNCGYAPLSPDLLDVPMLAGEPYQTMLYDFVLRRHLAGLVPEPPASILEIGVGLGGGLVYASHAYPQARLHGIDLNAAAIAVARRRLGKQSACELTSANGAALPYPDGMFDRVVSVGTASYIGIESFVAETARVVRPGGAISFSVGFTDAPWSGIVALMDKLAADNGLVIARLTDITPNALEALRADLARREKLVRPVPPPFRSYAREMADLPGTERYARYEAGRRTDFAAVMLKPWQGSVNRTVG